MAGGSVSPSPSSGLALRFTTVRAAWAAAINAFQDAGTGLFMAAAFEPHHTSDHEHTTAFATAALRLLGRAPRYPLRAFEQLADAANRSRWAPWIEDAGHSWDHRVAGVMARWDGVQRRCWRHRGGRRIR